MMNLWWRSPIIGKQKPINVAAFVQRSQLYYRQLGNYPFANRKRVVLHRR